MKLYLNILCIFFCLSITPVFSQVVDEIVVTGNKSKSLLLNSAGNIAFIAEEEIVFISSHAPAEILNRLPGFYISQGSGQEHLTSIRSPILSGGAGAGSFLYLEDGIPLRSPGFGNVNGLMETIMEIGERTEVIRGPGSVLYGSNAIHGVVNVLTELRDEDDHNHFGIHYSKHEAFADVSFFRSSVDESTSLKFYWKEDNGHSHNHGHEEDNGHEEEENFDQPHYGQQKFLLRKDIFKGSRNYTFSLSGTNLNQETMGYIKGFQAYKDEEKRSINPDPEAFRDTYSIRSYLKIVQELSKGSIILTPYLRYTDMDFKMHFLPGKPLEENSHKSLGLQVLYNRPFGNNVFYIGSDLEITEGDLNEFQSAPDVSFGPRLAYPNGAHYDYNIDSQIISFFINTEWNLNKKTSLTAGFRIENVEYNYNTNIESGTKGRIQIASNRSDDFTNVSPKLALNHKINESLSLFANLSRGSRAPQTTDLYRIQSKQIAGGAESEKLDSIEIGIRGLTGNLEFELVGYSMQKENFFFRDSQGFNVENGKTSHQGIEIGYYSKITENFEISGSASFAKHEYDFNHTPNGIEKGKTIDSAPDIIGNTRLSYLPTLGGRIEIEWLKIDDYPIDERNAHFYKGHDVFNLRAKFPLTEKINFGFSINNLTDEKYANRADYAFGNYRYFVGHEREFHFTFETEF